jgi:hypothetical protein
MLLDWTKFINKGAHLWEKGFNVLLQVHRNGANNLLDFK